MKSLPEPCAIGLSQRMISEPGRYIETGPMMDLAGYFSFAPDDSDAGRLDGSPLLLERARQL
jgi:hypothetical protein